MFIPDAAIVIGNGESRSILDLDSFRKKITLIGCNAIHRDLRVHHLVCCDQRMVREVTSTKRSSKIPFIYTRERYFHDFNKIEKNKRVQLVPDIPYEGTLKPDQPEHWGSGPYAVLLATSLGFNTIHLIGFDLYGKQHLLNNIYKGTQNYLSETANAVDPAYWIYQIKKIFLHFPDTKFKIYNNEDWVCPVEWRLPNVEVLSIRNFTLD